MKRTIIYIAAISTTVATVLTGCGSAASTKEAKTSESTNQTAASADEQVMSLELNYDSYTEDYLSNTSFEVYELQDGERTPVDAEAIESTVAAHIEECNEFFEKNKAQGIENAINKVLPPNTDVTEWFPEVIEACTESGLKKNYTISKVTMLIDTTGESAESKNVIYSSETKLNESGAYTYACGLDFWVFGSETNKEASEVGDMEESANKNSYREIGPVKYASSADDRNPDEHCNCTDAQLIIADDKVLEFDRQYFPDALPNDPADYYKVHGYEMTYEDGVYSFVPDKDSYFGNYGICKLNFQSKGLLVTGENMETQMGKSDNIIPGWSELSTEDDVLAYMKSYFGMDDEGKKDDETFDTATAADSDADVLNCSLSEYLNSKEIVWLEMNPEELIDGSNPDENTTVVGIIITSPDGTLLEARTPISNFGTLGELSKKSDDEIKNMAIDFINDFNNYEMVPCMSDNVREVLKKYIASEHHYTLTGVDINEYRNIKNYRLFRGNGGLKTATTPVFV